MTTLRSPLVAALALSLALCCGASWAHLRDDRCSRHRDYLTLSLAQPLRLTTRRDKGRNSDWGDKVLALLAVRDMTQAELARLISVHAPTLNQQISGRMHPPPPHIIRRIARVLQVRPKEIEP